MDNKKSLKRTCIAGLMVFSLSFVPIVAAETRDMNELKKQIETLQKRVDELEAEKADPGRGPGDPFRSRFQSGWDPFEEMERMQEEMGQMFQNSFSRRGIGGTGMFSNNISFDYDFDLQETQNGYEIRFDMGGLDQEKLDLEINEHSITIKGERSREDEEKSQNAYFSSRSFGSFMKTIPLPVDADTAKAKTEKEGQILVIRLPKKNL